MESYLVYEICSIVSTLVFIVIAFYLIKVLKALFVSFTHLNASVSKIETKIIPITDESIKLLENANGIAESVRDKLSDLDPLMGSISDMGSALHNATSSFTKKNESSSHKFFHKEEKRDWQDIANDLINIVTLGVIIWQKIKKSRRQ